MPGPELHFDIRIPFEPGMEAEAERHRSRSHIGQRQGDTEPAGRQLEPLGCPIGIGLAGSNVLETQQHRPVVALLGGPGEMPAGAVHIEPFGRIVRGKAPGPVAEVEGVAGDAVGVWNHGEHGDAEHIAGGAIGVRKGPHQLDAAMAKPGDAAANFGDKTEAQVAGGEFDHAGLRNCGHNLCSTRHRR